MADVYLSYSHRDRVAAERIAAALRRAGLTVWFDPSLRGNDVTSEQPSEIASASTVVVLWSAHSAKSEWVKREVSEADHIISIYLEPIPQQIHGGMHLAIDLSEWNGSPDDPRLQRLVEGIRTRSELDPLILLDPTRRTPGEPQRTINPPRTDTPPPPPSAAPSKGRDDDPFSTPDKTIRPRPRPRAAPNAIKDAVSPQRTMVAVNCPNVIGTAWQKIRAYLYPESEEWKVRRDAQQLRPGADGQHTSRHASVSKIRVGTPITMIIHLPNAECRRTAQRFTWRGHWHKTNFFVRYAGEPINEPQAGSISWFAGMVCVGEVSFDVHFTSERQVLSGPASLARAPGYESVFVSYSTKDSAIVDWLDTTYSALGMTYLRDIKTLRSGERWDETLLKLIQRADLFQLCWSANAKQSLEVTNEWRFALGMQKPNFIRPCYWDEPMPEPPQELQRLHFTRLRLNWWMRMWLRLRARLG